MDRILQKLALYPRSVYGYQYQSVHVNLLHLRSDFSDSARPNYVAIEPLVANQGIFLRSIWTFYITHQSCIRSGSSHQRLARSLLCRDGRTDSTADNKPVKRRKTRSLHKDNVLRVNYVRQLCELAIVAHWTTLTVNFAGVYAICLTFFSLTVGETAFTRTMHTVLLLPHFGFFMCHPRRGYAFYDEIKELNYLIFATWLVNSNIQQMLFNPAPVTALPAQTGQQLPFFRTGWSQSRRGHCLCLQKAMPVLHSHSVHIPSTHFSPSLYSFSLYEQFTRSTDVSRVDDTVRNDLQLLSTWLHTLKKPTNSTSIAEFIDNQAICRRTPTPFTYRHFLLVATERNRD